MEQLRDEIEKLGLTPSQAKAYLAVVKLGSCKAQEIARQAHLQRTDIYPLMSKLLSIGLVEQSLGRPTRYRPASIRDTIPVLAKEMTKRFSSIAEKSNDLVAQLETLANAPPERLEPEVRVITGPRKIRRHYFESLASAQGEVWTVWGRERLLHTSASDVRDASAIISSRHIKTRLITEIDRSNLRSLMLGAPLVEVRHYSPLQVHLIGLDNCSVTMGLTPEDTNDPYKGSQIVVTHRPLVEAMRSFFDAVWNDATPLAARVAMLQRRSPVLRGETRVIWSREEIYGKITKEWGGKARTRISSMMTVCGPIRILRGARGILEEARSRGVSIQVMCNVCRKNLSAVRELSTIAEVRHNSTPLTVGLELLDESEGLIHHVYDDTPDIRSPADVAIFITDAQSLRGLRKTFDVVWERSVPLKSRLSELSLRREPRS